MNHFDSSLSFDCSGIRFALYSFLPQLLYQCSWDQCLRSCPPAALKACWWFNRWTSFGVLRSRFIKLGQCKKQVLHLYEFGIFVELALNTAHLNCESKAACHSSWNHFRSFGVSYYTCFLRLEFTCCNLSFSQTVTFGCWTLCNLSFWIWSTLKLLAGPPGHWPSKSCYPLDFVANCSWHNFNTNLSNPHVIPLNHLDFKVEYHDSGSTTCSEL